MAASSDIESISPRTLSARPPNALSSSVTMVASWSTPLRDNSAPKVASALSICGPSSVWLGGITSPSRSARWGASCALLSRTNGLPRAEGSSTLATVPESRPPASARLSCTEAPEAARFIPLTRPTTFCPLRTSAPMVMPSAVGSTTVTAMVSVGEVRPSGRS